ncbi:MAG: hypothetical protein KGM98_02955, partial [Bacteroidota bacterium]|nr:hypothetical protein [Bacteroidota bacterium]
MTKVQDRKQEYTQLKEKLAARDREIRTEKSLEKVRGIALRMKAPEDMPQICKEISLQLSALGVPDIRNVQTAIFYPTRGTYMNYEYYARHDKTFVTETVYTNHRVTKAFAKKMLEGKGKSYTTHILGDKVKDWIAYQKTTNVFIDKYLKTASSLHYYWFSLGPVALGISTYVAMTKERQLLFNRFLKVFELAYTRYLDIERAIARAREAQIEAALERVRTRSIAMHKSEEIAAIAGTIFSELRKLDLALNRVLIWIYHEKEKYLKWWSANPEVESTADSYRIDYNKNPVFMSYLRAWKKRKPIYLLTLSGQGKKNWEDHLFKHTEMSRLPAAVKKGMRDEGTLYTVSVISDYGLMMSGSFTPLSEESIDIIRRFGRVFQQSYTRYLDVQKAEAQARESEIQLALERVRARTMAMQNSEELSEVVYLLFTQFGKLGEDPDQATIGIIQEKERLIEYWVTMYKKPIARVFKFSIDEPNVTKKIFEGWKARKKSIVIDLSGKALREFSRYRARMGGAKYNPKEKHRIVNVAFFSKGLLNVQSTQARSEESLKLLERFAQVFDQTYTRFLDLKKAEAQAWEARIEAALERVRSRAMAMHASPELKEVARELRNQISLLGQKELETCAIHLWDKSNRRFEGWAALRSPDNKGEIIESESSLEIKGIRILEEAFTQYVSGKKNYVLVNDVARAREFFAALKPVDPRAYAFLSRTIKNRKPSDICAYWTVSDFKGGSLVMVTMNPPEDQSRKLLQRFAGVFGMAYQRYLDIKNAEAQARESEIQLALERVRARTMAMQKSEELAQAATLLFQQVKQLGIKTYSSGFNIWDEKNRQLVSWMSNPARVLNPPFIMPQTEYHQHARFYKAWKSKVPFLEDDLTGARLKKHYQYLRSFPLLDKAFATSEKMGFHTPDRQVHNATFFSHGYLLFITMEPSPAHHEIFKRFGQVFEQTYTRFLDLKKAEAQARESQIEAALERVRSRAMAMQKSDELADLVATLFSELNQLKFGLTRCFIYIMDPKTLSMQSWTANLETREIPQSYRLPYLVIPYYKALVKAWKSKRKKLVYELGGAEKIETDKVLLNDTEYRNLPEVVKAGMKVPDRVFLSFAFNKFGALQTGGLEPMADENLDILARFAKVFEQNYARFLDLKKAEAQAREAQIEAALERVRSRSMGMQKSEELHEVIKVVYQQLIHLNIRLDHAGFVVDYKPGGDWTFWIADEQDIPSRITHPHFESEWATQFNDAKQCGTEYFHTHLDFEEKNQFYQKLLSYVPGLPGEARDFYLTCPSLDAITVLGKDASLYIENFEGIPYGVEDREILIRFGRVFQQTYTRFLDLQNSEFQLREARIEAALEKVRSRSLAMHKSIELKDIVLLVFERLHALGVAVEGGVTITIYTEGSRDQLQWVAAPDLITANLFRLPYTDDPIISDHILAKESGVDFFSKTYSRKEKNSMCEYLFTKTDFQYLPDEVKKMVMQSESYSQSIAFAKSSSIFINSFVGKLVSEEEADIMKRFARVFDQAYVRFLDLQKAEIQAREAQIEAALEKVRSRTLAMQKSGELAETAAVLFQQLIHLGIEPNRLYIGILQENSGEIEFWITGEDGSRISTMFKGDANKNASIKKMRDAWSRQEKTLVIDMKEKELTDYFHYLGEELHVPFKGGLSQKRRWQYLAFFSRGFIGIASPDEQPHSTLQLLERFASVFNLTFTRFNDLKLAEAHALQAELDLEAIKTARKKAEDALAELRATQKQLIQSEKMASLGE